MIPYNYMQRDLARRAQEQRPLYSYTTHGTQVAEQYPITAEVAIYTVLTTAVVLFVWLLCGLTRWRMRETWHHYEPLLAKKKTTKMSS